MRRCLFLFLILFIPLCSFSEILKNVDIEVCFTPGGNCTQEIVNAINHAERTILVQAYSFTSAPIAKALVNAKERGVNVKVILDKSQFKSEKYSSSKFLANQNIPVWIDNRVAIAHNKVMVIDDREVLTGSFNFTKAAQYKNAENLLIIQSPELAKLYSQNWQRRLAVSASLSQFALLSFKKGNVKRKKDIVLFDQ